MLSYIYLWFLPLVPLALMAWLVWSRNMSFGYWFATSQCLAWSLGTLSYYALPTLGPGLEYRPLYIDLAHTPTDDLMRSLVEARHRSSPAVTTAPASRASSTRSRASPACTARSRCWSR